MTIKETRDAYLTSLPGVKSENTIKAYSSALDRFIAFVGDDTPIEQIGKEQIEKYRSYLLADGCSPNGAADYLNKAKIFFEWAVVRGYVAVNPIATKDLPKKREIEYNLLSKEQIEQILADAPKKVRGMARKNRARNVAIVRVLVCSGLRNAELRALTVGDLDFERGTIRVRHGKGDKYRLTPFPAPAREAVAAYLEEQTAAGNPLGAEQTLFGSSADASGHDQPGAWHPMSAVALEKMVGAYTAAVCGNSVCVHALRHAAASYWDDLGVGMRDVQNALGHASIRTTERVYVKRLNKGKSAAAINAAFGA